MSDLRCYGSYYAKGFKHSPLQWRRRLYVKPNRLPFARSNLAKSNARREGKRIYESNIHSYSLVNVLCVFSLQFLLLLLLYAWLSVHSARKCRRWLLNMHFLWFVRPLFVNHYKLLCNSYNDGLKAVKSLLYFKKLASSTEEMCTIFLLTLLFLSYVYFVANVQYFISGFHPVQAFNSNEFIVLFALNHLCAPMKILYLQNSFNLWVRHLTDFNDLFCLSNFRSTILWQNMIKAITDGHVNGRS